ncbi:hypothetical protein KY284_003189 [Solanum tuberosum]|nr:hypothetical protein KY284_003189 [Solanum tuberosum]
MAISSNKSPSPLSARPVPPPHSRTSENTRRSFTGNPFSRPSVLSTHRGFNPVTPANSPADSARRVSNPGKEGLSWGNEEKENESKAAKLKSPAKGSKNFMSPTISASSKIAQSPKKKILVERNDPVRTSITFSDGKATFFSSNSEEHNQNSEKSFEGTENVMEPKEIVNVEGLPPVTKAPKKVTFLEVHSNCNNASESLSDTVTMDSDICNDEPLVSPAIAPLDADPSLPPYDPKTNYLSPRPQFLHYKPNPMIEVLLNKGKGMDAGEAKKLDDIFLSELLSENLSDIDGSESSLTEDSLKESDGSSSEEMLIEATVYQEEEEGPKVSVAAIPVAEESAEPALPVAEDISEAKMRAKPRSLPISKFFSLLLVLVIAFLSISVTDSPILATPGTVDLSFSNLSIPSDIPVLAKANSYFKQYSGESSSKYHDGYLKGSTGSEELDIEIEPIELEEDDEESETEPDEEEFQMKADLDDGDELKIEEVHELEIEEASTIQLAEVNESDSLEKDLEQGQHDLVETEEVSVVIAEENEANISERDLDQGLTTSNVQFELAESEYIVDNAISTDAAFELMNDNPETLVKDDSAVEDVQTLEMMQSPIDINDGDNAGAYQILGISSLALSLLAATVFYVKRSDKTMHPVIVRADQVSSKKFAKHHVVKEKHSSQNWPTEVDVAGESCPSEMSSFQISSSYSKKDPKSENDEAQSIEKKPRKSNKRESLTASEFSMGSPSYGSFTTYERIPIKNASGGEEVITPVRRSSRIRSHVISP